MNITISNKEVLYDETDQPIVDSYKWHVNDSGYAVWRGVKDGKKKTVRLHRLINNTPVGMITDHINHNKLDNRRRNLRSCTASDNMRNKTNQGRGYWYHRRNNNWVVEICGEHIGCFTKESDAANVAHLIRSGGTYTKPIKMICKYGHDMSDAYYYGKSRICKKCLSIREKKYYAQRKTN